MSNELVPERRVNKLGHLVTKHVRGDGSRRNGSGILATLAPSLDRKLAEKAERRSLVSHVSEAMEYWYQWGDKPENSRYDDRERRQGFCDSLSKFSIESLRYVAGRCDTNASWDEQGRVMMVITHRSAIEDWAVAGLRYRSLLGDPKDELTFLKRLSEVNSYFSDDKYLAPAEEGTSESTFNVSVVGFALRVHDYVMGSAGKINMDSGHSDYFTPVSRELVQVFRDYPDRIDDVFDFMTDRYLVPCMVSDDMLREHLDSPRTPLRIGAL